MINNFYGRDIMQLNKPIKVFAVLILLPVILLATSIRIAPNVLNIGSNGTVVTVHTNLPYSSVVAATVTLNGLEIQSWKADSRGNFVAKFSMSAVKALVISGALNLGQATLTLEGMTGGGDDFAASSTIMVVSR